MADESRQGSKRPTCPKCGNRLRILPDQIGTTVRCPKCNATFVVGRSQDQAKGAAPASEDDAYEPIIPLPRPTMVPEEEMADLNPAAARAHDVFISYAQADKKVAEAICVRLESRDIRCWMAPRDLRPGAEYTAEIIRGIEGCRILTLVFSSEANVSPHVRREVERAVSKGRTVLPFRISDVMPTPELEYLISGTHWLDAVTPPIEAHIQSLVRVIEANLDADLNPAAARETVYETDWRTADDMEAEAPVERPAVAEQELLEAARARGLFRDELLPDPPRFTFFSGVFTFPWKGANVTRWTAMSFGLGISLVMTITALEWLGFLGGQANMMLGVLLTMFTAILTLAVLSFAAVSCQAAIQDTADGHDEPLEASLPDWDQWVFTLLAWMMLWAASAAIGYPLSLVIGPMAFLITSTLLFPVLLLSAMECESFIVPFSPPVLRTLGYYFHGWLTFQVMTVVLFAGWITAFDYGFPQAPHLTALFSGPVLATIMLIYARLLGRLAWKASGAPMARVQGADKGDGERPADSAPGAKKSKPPRRKRRKSIQIEIPDEFDSGEGPQQPPPRINFHLRP